MVIVELRGSSAAMFGVSVGWYLLQDKQTHQFQAKLTNKIAMADFCAFCLAMEDSGNDRGNEIGKVNIKDSVLC